MGVPAASSTVFPKVTAAQAAVPYIIKEAIQNSGKDHEDQVPSLSILDETESQDNQIKPD